MNLPFESTTEILDRHISGFRQYRLGDTVRLTFISRNCCHMTGYPREELENGCSPDLYAHLIHPADKHLYDGLLEQVRRTRATASAEYRLLRKDGSVLFVRDTMTVGEAEEPGITAYSTLTDITELMAEVTDLRFLRDTVPCGMLKFNCGKNSEVTFINRRLLDILRFPETREGEISYLELCKSNIFLTIPMEERGRFAAFLNRAYEADAPLSGEISVLRCDGTKARLYGWVNKAVTEDGREEFHCVCMDITERYHNKRAGDTQRYLKALSEVYEKIFEYDFANGTVKYVSGESDTFNRIRNLPMHMEEATNRWVLNTVCAEDRPAMQSFFADVFTRKMMMGDSLPPQIRYRVKKEDGLCAYTGIFLKIDPHVALFCCRKVRDESEAEALRHENLSLKNRNESMKEVILRYADGVAAFEVTGDRVTPLYASDNACEFFGYTREEWFPLMQKSTSIQEFVAGSAVDYEKFSELLRAGEAEFTYYDIHTEREKRIKAICSHRQADENAPRYVMLYKMPSPTPDADERTRDLKISVRTFGYFDIFVNDKPIAFRNKKAKELLAILVDRRGGYVTSEQAISYLWENEPASAVTLARYRKEALRLKNTLEEYGIGHILESVDGKRRIIPECLDCDLYGYLAGKEEYAGAFKGSYLTDYPWAEVTLGELMNDLQST